MARHLTTAQYEALEQGYERDNHRVAAHGRTLRALRDRGLVTEPIPATATSHSYAYLTTAGIAAVEAGY